MKYNFNSVEHLHSLDDKPLTGTSTVCGVLYKPLTWWAAGKTLEVLGWTNSKKKIDGEYVFTPDGERIKILLPKYSELLKSSPEEFLRLLDKAYRAHSEFTKDAADKGTDLHAELEKYVKFKMGVGPEVAFHERISPFIKWTERSVKKFIWSEAHCYDEELWVGGISDAGVELNTGEVAVIDFKSSKEAYTSHFIQCAGYATQINKNGLFTKEGALIKKLEKPINSLIVIPFGAKGAEPQIRYVVKPFQDGFEAAVCLYRLLGLNDGH